MGSRTQPKKVAVHYILDAIRPEHLQSRLREDLNFSHYHLKKKFKGFMAHAIKLAEAFQLVNSGRSRGTGHALNPI